MKNTLKNIASYFEAKTKLFNTANVRMVMFIQRINTHRKIPNTPLKHVRLSHVSVLNHEVVTYFHCINNLPHLILICSR